MKQAEESARRAAEEKAKLEVEEAERQAVETAKEAEEAIMTEDTSPENLRKFLESDVPAIQLMGISLAKIIKYPEDIQPILMSLTLFSSEENIRKDALTCVKDIGIEKIAMPTQKEWNDKMKSDYFFPPSNPGIGNLELTKLKTMRKWLIETLISLGSTKSLKYLKDIFVAQHHRLFFKEFEMIINGITEVYDKNKCMKFYDGLLHSKKPPFTPLSWDKPSIWDTQIATLTPSRIRNVYSIYERKAAKLILILSAYVEINAQERHGIIFSKIFGELVRAITGKATTEEKQGTDLGDFIKKGMGLCLKLDKKAPGGDSEITLLLLQKHLYSDSREEKIAAAQVFEMLYKSNPRERKLRKRISEIGEPTRKDRLGLVRNALKTVK